jgi:predicted phosphate transport protein (TIGR00153 family)
VVQKLEVLVGQNSISDHEAEEIHELEHQADKITAEIVDRLNSTFITPMDREDIYTLAQSLDDIVDLTQGAVERMALYKTKKPSIGAQELVRTTVKAADQIKIAFSYLNNIHFKKTEILAAAEEIYQLESLADTFYRQEVARLFEHEKDPVEIIKWKEILEILEDTVDHCEDIADLLKGVVLKYD